MTKKLIYNVFVKTALVVGFFLLFTVNNVLQAQKPDFATLDSLTYAYYLKGNHEALVRTGQKAIEAGYDYYYLRMRLGLSAFHQRDYCAAAEQFEHALKFNDHDAVAQSYRMGSLLEMLRPAESGALFNRSVSAARNNIPIKKGFRIISTHIDAGLINRDESKLRGFQSLAGSDGIYGEQRIQGNTRLLDAGLLFAFAPNFMVYTGVQHIETQVTDRFAFLDNQLAIDSVSTNDWGDAYYYKVVSEGKISSFDHSIVQKSGFVQTRWAPAPKVLLTFSGHWMDIFQSQTLGSADSLLVTDTSYVITATDTAVMFDTYLKSIRFNDQSIHSSDWNLSAQAKFHTVKTSISTGLSLSKLNETLVKQLSLGFTVYPMGNTDFYSHTEGHFLFDMGKKSAVFKESIGLRLAKPLWIEAGIVAGDISRFSDQNGYIVYNSIEDIRLKFESVAYLVLNKHLQFTVRFRFQSAENSYFVFQESVIDMQEKIITNQAKTIIGGIKWSF